MKILKRNAVVLTGMIVLSVSACTSQATNVETQPANRNSATQQSSGQPSSAQQGLNQPDPKAQQSSTKQQSPISQEPEVEISLPMDESAAVGSIVTIPVSFTKKTDKEVFSYSFGILFDPKVLQPTEQPIDTAGTVSGSANFTVVADTKTAGRLGVAAAGMSNTIKTSGVLLNTRFKVVGKGADKMDLKFENPVFEDTAGNAVNVTLTKKR